MGTIIFLTIWFGLAFWCYSIAKRNGRNAIFGALAGFLFGVLGVIIYSIMGKTDEVRRREIAEIAKEVNKK